MKTVRLVVSIIFLLSFTSGCSVHYYPFFRNYSIYPIEIIFKNSIKTPALPHSFPFKNEIIDIDQNSYKKLDQKLELFQVGEDYIVTVPPGSTVVINGDVYRYNLGYVYLRQENKVDSIAIKSFKDLKTSLKHVNVGFPKKALYYYDYGDSN
jgi:hypothetical protein